MQEAREQAALARETLAGTEIEDIECYGSAWAIRLRNRSRGAQPLAADALSTLAGLEGTKLFSYDHERLLMTAYVVSGDNAAPRPE